MRSPEISLSNKEVGTIEKTVSVSAKALLVGGLGFLLIGRGDLALNLLLGSGIFYAFQNQLEKQRQNK